MRARVKFLGVMLFALFALLIGATAAVILNPIYGKATANTKTNDSEYEIYPVPHSVVYGDGTAELPDALGIRFGDGIDDATVERAYAALSEADVLARRDGDGYCVYVGVYGSGDAADAYVKANGISHAPDLFDKIDAYLLDVSDKAITILGKDTDAAFYGATTLKMILAQSGRGVRRLKIEDWSDTVFRGFIEGYYGVPWTTAQRVELMEFGGEFKSNIYIYAPKDDAYHSANWRGLYSDADLAELKEQIAAGVRTKTRFAWALHPFLHDKFTQGNYDRDLNDVLKKLEQLYAAGVRQFVISADDVDTSGGNKIDGGMHRDLLNDVSAWLENKRDCYRLIFVPSAYNYTANSTVHVDLRHYFDTLTLNLDPSVYVMWTGNAVCSSVENGRFDEFIELADRKAFMWLNWPVNDYAQSYLLMGKGEVLNKRYDGEPNFHGIVTNPMQHAEASKPSIFAVADYCWNINAFDADDSYAASLGYIERGATDALYALCDHLVNATPFEGEYFAESTAIKPYIDAFVAAYADGGDFKESASALKAQFDKIVSDAEYYLENAQNVKLKAEISPWINSLKLLAAACADYADILVGLDARTPAELSAQFDRAEKASAARRECRSPVLDAVTYNKKGETVSVAPAVLAPFAATLRGIAQDELSLKLGVDTGNTYRGFAGIYQGEMENVTDGDDATFVWFDGKPQEGACVRIDLGAPVEVRDIRVLTGKPDGSDVMTGEVQYSLDGKTYTRLGALTGAGTVIDVRENPITARFIRLADGGTQTWVAVREVAVNRLGDIDRKLTFGGLEIYEGSIVNAIDGDDSTYVWFKDYTADSYIELDLLREQTVSVVRLAMGGVGASAGDRFAAFTLSYSTDGVNYTVLGEYSGDAPITLDAPVVARYVRATATSAGDTWAIVREFGVNE